MTRDVISRENRDKYRKREVNEPKSKENEPITIITKKEPDKQQENTEKPQETQTTHRKLHKSVKEIRAEAKEIMQLPKSDNVSK